LAAVTAAVAVAAAAASAAAVAVATAAQQEKAATTIAKAFKKYKSKSAASALSSASAPASTAVTASALSSASSSAPASALSSASAPASTAVTASAAAAGVAAGVAAVVASPVIAIGGLIAAAAKSIVTLSTKTTQPIITNDPQSDMHKVVDPLLKEIKSKINSNVVDNNMFINEIKKQIELNHQDLEKLKKVANAIQSPPSSGIQNDIQELTQLLKTVNDDISNIKSMDLQTELNGYIQHIKTNIDNIKSHHMNDYNKEILKIIKTNSERLTGQYKEMEGATEELKKKITEHIKQYNTGFNTTKEKVLTGIRQTLDATLGTLAEPPSDNRGAGLIKEINTLLNSVD